MAEIAQLDPQQRFAQEARLKAYRKLNSIQVTYTDAYAEGYVEGYVAGYVEGMAAMQRIITKRLLALGQLTHEQIAELASLPLAEVQALAEA